MFVLFIILASLIGSLMSLALVVFIVLALRRASTPPRQHGGGEPPWLRALEQMQLDTSYVNSMLLLHALIQQAQIHQAQASQTQGYVVPPQLQAQFQQQMLKAQQDRAALDDLSRQRSDTFMADMLGDAASVGLDVSSWNLM